MAGNLSVTGHRSTSLPEVHRSVSISHLSLWRRMVAFAGPAYLVSVGYMDPGNWATDLEGGARFGFGLLWVLVVSNLMAILLQTLSARLGIVTQRDLAQACREAYPRPVSYCLWVLCEIAIAACDLAEVLGAAIALNLLFHLPLLIGVLATAADTLLILWLTRLGIRVVEAFILALIVVIAGCFAVEILWAAPDFGQLGARLFPRIDGQSLFVAVSILGATVMPHNLYLHSALVQTRQIGVSTKEKEAACRYNLLDSTIALNGALLVNAAILIVAASVFFRRHIVVTEIQQAYLLLSPLLGTSGASLLFACALLCSGQSSTLTGTMAGQIVMEGFLGLRMRPWLRRLTTRLLAITPAVLTIILFGERAVFELLLISQVVLSLQLPFAIVPLIQFTSSKSRMGKFANAGWVKVLSWFTAALIISLNIWLVIDSFGTAFRSGQAVWLVVLCSLIAAGLAALLAWMIFTPPLQRPVAGTEAVELPQEVAEDLPQPAYRKILVPLDHTDRDRAAISHAAAMARLQNGILYLLHVEEGVTSQMYGSLASTAEVEAGNAYLSGIAEALAREGVHVETVVRHSKTPKNEIVRYARELRPDLIVVGAHGHKGLKDLVFGATINAVRHKLKIPLLVVRDEG